MKHEHQNSKKEPAVSSLHGNDNKGRRKRSKRKTALKPTAVATPSVLSPVLPQAAEASEWFVMLLDDLPTQDIAVLARIFTEAGIEFRVQVRPKEL